MPFDYSQAGDPRDFSELIPHNTVATVQMRIRPGGVGEDGLLKRTSKGDAEMLDCEFVVVDGPYAKRQLTGEKWDDKNYLAGAIGPEHKDWHPVEQPPPFNGGGATATPSTAAPAQPTPGSTPITPPKWASQ